MTETDWTFDEEITQLQEGIDEIAAKSRIEETKKMINSLEVRLIRIIFVVFE